MTAVVDEGITERIGERTIVAILLTLAITVLLGGVLALAADEDRIPAAGARVEIDGIGTFTRTDGDGGPLRDGTLLEPGDEVEMQEGSAVLQLAAGGTVEVRSGVGDVDDTRLEVGSPVRLLAGDALVEGPVGIAVEAAGTLVTLRDPEGTAARIRRELAVTTATYRGDVDIDSAGQARGVPAYRQLSVASVGRIPEEPEPLEVDDRDPWDRRFLGGAIELTDTLESFSASFTAQGVLRSTAEDFAAVLPILADEDGFVTRLIQDARPDGETLVGGAIAALATGGAFDDRWVDVFAFRDAGAAWGLVALDQGVDQGPVVGEVEAALDRSVAPTTPEVAAPVTTPTTAADTSPAVTNPPPTAATTVPVTTPPPTAPPATPPPIVPTLPTVPPIDPTDPVPETGNGLLDGVLEPVGDLLAGLLGG